VVTVDIAEGELAAVRAMLDQLRDDVHHEERAAAAAEDQIVVSPVAPRGSPELEAIEVSRRIVQQMAAARRGEILTAEQEALVAAQARVVDARRHAQDLAAAAHRDVAHVLRARFPGVAGPVPPPEAGDDLPHWEAPDDDALEQERLQYEAREAEPFPAMQHWAEPAPARPTEAPAPPVVVVPDDATRAHEQFWREEAQATAARGAGVTPVEVLLPTAALLLLLVAVLLLIH
jgi:hypothetical protein